MVATESMEKQLKDAACKECGGTSWGNRKSTHKVMCMTCDAPWDGDVDSYPDGASVSYHVYPEWWKTNQGA